MASTSEPAPRDRVLVVMEEGERAAYLLRLLETEGFEVTIAPDALSASALASQGSYVVVLADASSEAGPGYETTRLLREDDDAARTPIMLILPTQCAQAMVRALVCGADSFVSVDLHAEKLVSRLRVLAGARAVTDGGMDDPVDLELTLDGRIHRFSCRPSRLRTMMKTAAGEELEARQLLAHQQRHLAEVQRQKAHTDTWLVASEARYRTLVEQASVAILILDRQGRVRSVNRMAETMLRRPSHQMVSVSLRHLAAPLDEARMAGAFEAMMREGQVRLDDVRLLRGDGTEVRCALSATRGDDGGEGSFLAMASDVTERRRVEESLRQSEERFRRLVESSDDIVFTIDDKRRFLDTYGKGLSRLGIEVAAMMGRAPAELLDPDKAEAHERAIDRALAGESLAYEWVADTPDGTRYMLTSLSPLRDSRGDVSAVVGINRDVTHARLLESQVMVSDRMASVGTLAAGVAHEINNPFAAISANVEYSLSELDALDLEGDPEISPDVAGAVARVAEALREARLASASVRKIVRDLNLFARSRQSSLEAVDLRGVLESSIPLAWNEIRHRARLRREYHDVPPVWGNGARLGQVFLNLLVHAAQAIPDGDAEHHEIRVAIDQIADSCVEVTVESSREVVPPDKQGLLFDPLLAIEHAGTLGLAMSYKIVRGMGGILQAKPTEVGGTALCVRLPIAAPSQPPTEVPSDREPHRSRRGRVLVLDNPEGVQFVSQALEAYHDIDAAESSSDALRQIAAGASYDVVVCDPFYSGVDGLGFYTAVRQQGSEAHRRLIFVTAQADDTARRSFLEQTRVPFLEKPLEARVLRAYVNERVRQQAAG